MNHIASTGLQMLRTLRHPFVGKKHRLWRVEDVMPKTVASAGVTALPSQLSSHHRGLHFGVCKMALLGWTEAPQSSKTGVTHSLFHGRPPSLVLAAGDVCHLSPQLPHAVLVFTHLSVHIISILNLIQLPLGLFSQRHTLSLAYI